MALTGTDKQVIEFTKALGLDPSKVQAITIYISLDDCVRLEVTELVKSDEVERAMKVVKTYNLEAVQE